jgi:hypothetical protein
MESAESKWIQMSQIIAGIGPAGQGFPVAIVNVQSTPHARTIVVAGRDGGRPGDQGWTSQALQSLAQLRVARNCVRTRPFPDAGKRQFQGRRMADSPAPAMKIPGGFP